jgi:hypothetical protein
VPRPDRQDERLVVRRSISSGAPSKATSRAGPPPFPGERARGRGSPCASISSSGQCAPRGRRRGRRAGGVELRQERRQPAFRQRLEG